jgi:DNA modification methylase
VRVSESFLKDRVVLHCGDCRDVLATLEENSIDSCCTDPPYHLTSQYGRLSTGFMGKQWDGGDIAFRPEPWAQVYRVLKPGAHLLAFGGTRTYHRMACAIEDAGFEIRDCVQWLYGSGFPKSHDVSKGIDRARKDSADWQRVGNWLRKQREAKDLKQKDVAVLWPSATGGLTGCVANWELGLSCPKWDQWLQLKAFIGLDDNMDAEVWRLNGRKGTPGEAWQEAELLGIDSRMNAPSGIVSCGRDQISVDREIKKANSDAARQWEGWGTALKPAVELCVLARKPLSEGTVAANVLKWGTGAINVDGCRVATDEITGRPQYESKGWKNTSGMTGSITDDWKKGRWPANVIHDGSEEVVGAFPSPHGSGYVCSYEHNGDYNATSYDMSGARNVSRFGDEGSAARFFYTSKADFDDRLGSKHPTVKPLDLMQYLVRLITPPKGTCLDPFAGTGTTGEAAFREGMSAVLIERETEYQDDIRRRMKLIMSGPDERARESIKQRMNGKPVDNGPLFNFYNADRDFSESLNECYRDIRERVANGGPGWGGWPE